MVLSDRDLLHCLRVTKDLKIDPLDEAQVQPASVDLKLSDEFIRMRDPYRPGPGGAVPGYYVQEQPIDLDDIKGTHNLTVEEKTEEFVLGPGEFALASTEERVGLSDKLVARVEGKSSLGRIGLLIHATAGFIDPGFEGKITLEIYNLNRLPMVLRAGKPICQLSVMMLTTPAENPYGSSALNSKYQGQTTVTGSRYAG